MSVSGWISDYNHSETSMGHLAGMVLTTLGMDIPEAQHGNWDKDTFPSTRLCHSGLHHRSAIAVGLFSVLLALGQVTGVAIGCLAFQNHGADKIELKKAHTDSIPIVWAVCCGVSGIFLMLSAWTESYDLNCALAIKQQ